MNKYSFESMGDVIITVLNDCVINNKKYEKGEPLAYFKEISAQVTYRNSLKESAVAGRTILVGNSLASIDRLILSNISFQESLANLLFANNYDIINIVSRVSDIDAENGKLFIPIISSNSIQPTDIFIYDKDKNRIKNFTLDLENGIITLDQPYNDKFKVFYKEILKNYSIADKYLCKNVSVPLLSVTLQSQGNINGRDAFMQLHLPRVSLVSAPKLSFSSGAPYSYELVFDCIDVDKDFIKLDYYGN